MFVPLRGRAVAARRAHNPEVSGSNPLPATQKTLEEVSFLLVQIPSRDNFQPPMPDQETPEEKSSLFIRVPSRDDIQSPLPDPQHLKSYLFGNKETEYILEDHLLRILIICKLPYYRIDQF